MRVAVPVAAALAATALSGCFDGSVRTPTQATETAPAHSGKHREQGSGGPQEQPPDETVVDPRPDGPLFVHGRLRIVGDEGGVIREDTRVALCRCGGSANKPFCDGTHRRIGFSTG